MKASKKIILLASCLVVIANSANALTPKRCVEGAVWEINKWGEEELVDCVKWESHNPEAMVVEQEAIDRAFESGEYEVIQSEDITPPLGKLQNKLDKLSSKVFGLIGL